MSKVYLIILLEVEDRDIKGKEIMLENFSGDFRKDLSSAVKGQNIKAPAGIKERRQVP